MMGQEMQFAKEKKANEKRKKEMNEKMTRCHLDKELDGIEMSSFTTDATMLLKVV